jgi:hypothetical protein
VATELVTEVLDRQPLERLERHDHDLIAGLLLELGERCIQFPFVALVQEAGIVDHPTGQRRKFGLRRPNWARAH